MPERLATHRVVAGFGSHWHGFSRRNVGAAAFYTNRGCAMRRGNNDHSPGKGYLLCRAADGAVECRFVRLNG